MLVSVVLTRRGVSVVPVTSSSVPGTTCVTNAEEAKLLSSLADKSARRQILEKLIQIRKILMKVLSVLTFLVGFGKEIDEERRNRL